MWGALASFAEGGADGRLWWAGAVPLLNWWTADSRSLKGWSLLGEVAVLAFVGAVLSLRRVG
jgi:hypothetical protein